ERREHAGMLDHFRRNIFLDVLGTTDLHAAHGLAFLDFADRVDAPGEFRAVAAHGEHDVLVGARVHVALELEEVADARAVEAHDNIARHQPRLAGGTVRVDRLEFGRHHRHPVAKAEAFLEFVGLGELATRIGILDVDDQVALATVRAAHLQARYAVTTDCV